MICDPDEMLHEGLQAHEGKKYKSHFIITQTEGCFQTKRKIHNQVRKRPRKSGVWKAYQEVWIITLLRAVRFTQCASLLESDGEINH